MAESEPPLEDIFKKFCSFGAKDSPSSMDGTKFAKFCKDMKLLDKNLTTTDVDIIFAKSKPKTERKMTLEQFEVALGFLAEKKYPGQPDGVEKLKARIATGSGPLTHGVTVTDTSEGTQRMTDTSKYTGTHKLRYDEEGKGRGLAGRDSVAKGHGMSPGSVSSQQAYVSGYKHEGTYSLDKSSPKTEAKVKKMPTKAEKSDRPSDGKDKAQDKTDSPEKVQAGKSCGEKAHRAPEGKATGEKLHEDKPPGEKSGKAVGTKVSGEESKESKASVGKSQAQGEKKDIYDRLTDPSTYHATHKHRFDSSGKGRGLEGRDAPAKGAGMSPGSVKSQAAYVTGYKHEGTYGKAK